MFPEIERELLDSEFGLIKQHYPLPEQEGYKRRDICELPPQTSTVDQNIDQQKIKKMGFFSKLKGLGKLI